MFRLQSITTFFATHGNLRKSQRTTLAALVWALIRQPLLGIAAMGHSLAMAQTTSAKHAIKRVDRFLGNTRIDLEVACGDLITTVIGAAKEVHLTLDWTDPKTPDGRFQTLSCNVRAHGRALPIAWITVPKVELKHHMREYEHALCTRVAQLMPSSCHRHWSIMISRGGILSAIKTGFANRFLRSATQQPRPKVPRVSPSHSAHPASEKHTEPGVRQHVAQWDGSVQLGRNLRHSPRCGDSPRPRREMRGKNHQNHCLFSLRLVKTGDPSAPCLKAGASRGHLVNSMPRFVYVKGHFDSPEATEHTNRS